ncbi:MAG: hypothetical protein IAF38_15910 [Bacteroidia bacterium]|nr:hypothetical protein [Bacteroidia bacterium]
MVNWSGDLLYDLGMGFVTELNNDSIEIWLSHKRDVVLRNFGNEQVPANVYKLNVYEEKGDFFESYVLLSQKDKESYEKYLRLVNEKEAKEEKRKQSENTVLRQFQMKNFGIYNYDRIYHDSTAIGIEALVEMGSNLGGSEMTYFLVTGANERVVIRYSKEGLAKFYFKPTDPNILLAVLPDDKVAIFSKENFSKLDVEKLKKEKKYTFKMEILGKLESEARLKEILSGGNDS